VGLEKKRGEVGEKKEEKKRGEGGEKKEEKKRRRDETRDVRTNWEGQA
jgi:hypothetical protein